MKVTMMRKLRLVFALSAVVVMTAPVLGARSHAADDNPIAGLKDAKVAFDITAGDPGRLLNILNTIDETREGFGKRGVTPHFVLAFRGPATLLTQTDLSRLKPEDRETAAKIAAKLKQLRGAAGIEHLDQCSIAMRGQKVDKARVNPDVTVVENGWITLLGYSRKATPTSLLEVMGGHFVAPHMVNACAFRRSRLSP